MKDKIIKVLDKLSNIGSENESYRYHWSRFLITIFMIVSMVYLFPKGETVSFLEYLPSVYTFILAGMSGASLAINL